MPTELSAKMQSGSLSRGDLHKSKRTPSAAILENGEVKTWVLPEHTFGWLVWKVFGQRVPAQAQTTSSMCDELNQPVTVTKQKPGEIPSNSRLIGVVGIFGRPPRCQPHGAIVCVCVRAPNCEDSR